MQWKRPGSSHLRKCVGLQRDYKSIGTSITSVYYTNVIKQIKKNEKGKLAAGTLILYDNAPVHKSRVAQTAIRECKFEQLNHPPYIPDLAPSDYYLVPLAYNKISAATEAWFGDQTDDFYFKGVYC